MVLRHVVVASDESDAGRQAVRTGVDLAARSSGQVTVMRTVPIPAVPVFVGVRGGSDNFAMGGGSESVELERLGRWIEADVLPPDDRRGVELAIAYGVPGIEICRFGERREADLLVLGRKSRSRMARLLLGDTGDAVARRSRLPCLFVPPGAGSIRRLLVALDGSPRGLGVLQAACGFARATRSTLAVVTVERALSGEPAHLADAMPVERSARLQSQVRELLGREGPDRLDASVEVRRGPIVERVLETLEETAADVLVIGYHRGGPPGMLEAGSTARRLLHTAPASVLTIPL